MSVLKFLINIFNPFKIYRALRFANNQTETSKEELDTELVFYRDLLDSDFIHLGYFDDPDLPGSEVSFTDVTRAQERYADLLMEHVKDGPVLDSGCGAGGFLKKLRRANFSAVGLTPDQAQINHIREDQSDPELIHAKMEEIDTSEYENYFGTVVNMESFQYIDLEKGFDVTQDVLEPGGRWILAENFRKQSGTRDDSRHLIDRFRNKLDEEDWTIKHEQDITDNILVSIKFARLLADRIVVSSIDYATEKLLKKYPFVHGLLNDHIDQGRDKLQKKLKMIDPETFRQNKTYRLFVLEREGV
ncbi:MAG: cyclopropane-fatty-acyl-phospholipid synthase family protein [bacterium]